MNSCISRVQLACPDGVGAWGYKWLAGQPYSLVEFPVELPVV